MWTHILPILSMHALEMYMHNYVMNNTQIFVFVIGMQLASVGKILRVSLAFDTVLSLFLLCINYLWLGCCRTFPNAF